MRTLHYPALVGPNVEITNRVRVRPTEQDAIARHLKEWLARVEAGVAQAYDPDFLDAYSWAKERGATASIVKFTDVAYDEVGPWHELSVYLNFRNDADAVEWKLRFG